MGNLIIKPNTSGSLILQDEGGTDALSIATNGATTFAEMPTFTAQSYLRGGLKTWEIGFTAVNNNGNAAPDRSTVAAVQLANFTVPVHGAFFLFGSLGSEQWSTYKADIYTVGIFHETTIVITDVVNNLSTHVAGSFEYSKTTSTNFQVRKAAGNIYGNTVNGLIYFASTSA